MKSAIADLAAQRKAEPPKAIGVKGYFSAKPSAKPAESNSYAMSVSDLRSLLMTGEHVCGDTTLTVDTEDPTIQRMAEEIGDEDEPNTETAENDSEDA